MWWIAISKLKGEGAAGKRRTIWRKPSWPFIHSSVLNQCKTAVKPQCYPLVIHVDRMDAA